MFRICVLCVAVLLALSAVASACPVAVSSVAVVQSVPVVQQQVVAVQSPVVVQSFAAVQSVAGVNVCNVGCRSSANVRVNAVVRQPVRVFGGFSRSVQTIRTFNRF